MLDVAGRDVLIVGGGGVAARRAAALVEAGATVRVVSPDLVPALRMRHAAGELGWEARDWRAGDCAGAFMVVVATDDPAVNAAAVDEARRAGALVNDAELPERGDLSIPAVVRRGRLRAAVSSGGASPALAAFVRQRLEVELGPEFERLTELSVRMRERDRAAGLDADTREAAQSAALPRLLALLQAGRDAQAEQLADELSGGVGEPAWS